MGHLYNISSSQGSGSSQKKGQKDCKSKRRWMTPRKTSPLDTAGKLHIWTHSNWQCAQALWYKLSLENIPTWKGKGPQVSALAEELLTMDSYWVRKSQLVLFKAFPLVGLSHSNARPYIQEYMGSTTELNMLKKCFWWVGKGWKQKHISNMCFENVFSLVKDH